PNENKISYKASASSDLRGCWPPAMSVRKDIDLHTYTARIVHYDVMAANCSSAVETEVDWHCAESAPVILSGALRSRRTSGYFSKPHGIIGGPSTALRMTGASRRTALARRRNSVSGVLALPNRVW